MFNKKTLFAYSLCLGLAACSTNKPSENDTATETNQVAEPDKAEQAVIVPEEKVSEVKPEPTPRPEVEPKPLPTKTVEGKYIFGQEEWVYIPGLNKHFIAKVDTGATTSSVSATDIVKFERDGKDWVKFKINHGDKSSDEISLPVLRWAKIKQSNSEGSQKRPVVTSWVQIGEFKDKTEFTLADRTHMQTPVILGQSFFRDIAVVDISRKYVQSKSNH